MKPHIKIKRWAVAAKMRIKPELLITPEMKFKHLQNVARHFEPMRDHGLDFAYSSKRIYTYLVKTYNMFAINGAHSVIVESYGKRRNSK